MPVGVQALIVSIVQSLLTNGGSWLVDHKLTTPDMVSPFVLNTMATALVLYGWNWVQEHRKRQQVNTALALPKGSTRDDIQTAIKDGTAPPASVPADRAPYLKGEDKTGRYTPEDPPKPPDGL